jgi:hypothetical protein
LIFLIEPGKAWRETSPRQTFAYLRERKKAKLTEKFFSFLFHSTEPTGAANSKSAAIEMYAPSSYNDTVTGETLSSVSDKSDSYSNDGSQPDLTVNKFSSPPPTLAPLPMQTNWK